jgi:orotidine-5'-phosphate decarboxylase
MFLMPGVGAQGGDVAGALRAALDAHGGGVLPSASRSILYAEAGAGFERAAADAALALRRQANDARSATVGR